jgi:hypothetical protein
VIDPRVVLQVCLLPRDEQGRVGVLVKVFVQVVERGLRIIVRSK